jgi:hypothetical protein
MARYPLEFNKKEFIPWQPSTWPLPPVAYNDDFERVLERILRETLLDEIRNVISDSQASGHGLVHRGHVVALAMLCAVDTVSSYAFVKIKKPCPKCGRGDSIGPTYEKFIGTFFPEDYRPFAKDIYTLHRNSMVHSWNLFEAGILPGDDQITKVGNSLSFGLLNFFKALEISVQNFLTTLLTNPTLQEASLARYKELQKSALS